MTERVRDKLAILSDAAKYDVSCASSGSIRKNTSGGLGNATGMGICHSYTADGRCVSLLKILLTNHCIFDCAYCVSRKSNDVKRAAFTVKEVVDLTMEFYKRNYIEGLFLSSGIFKDADYTMERLVRIARDLRTEHKFNGYIHLKAIPGASQELLEEAGRYADRLSVNLEIPSEVSLKKVAPEKTYDAVYRPMNFLKESIAIYHAEKKSNPKVPLFAPGGQSTQLVIGATAENDFQIMKLAGSLYDKQKLRRVYYSGYVPISKDPRVPVLAQTPVIRENRLYQADWLLRFYGFKVDELLNESNPHLDLRLDPKLMYALRHPEEFPVDINRASYAKILRVPGIGVKSATKVVHARKFGKIRLDQLRKFGIAWNRARYFLSDAGSSAALLQKDPSLVERQLIHELGGFTNQIPLFS